MPGESFAQWLRVLGETGNISPLRLGMSRDELRALFGDPDDVGGTSRRQRTPTVWLYGTIEFHFGSGPDAGLELIFEKNAHGGVRLSIGRRHGP